MEVAAVEEEMPETVTKMVFIGGAKNRTEGVEREEDLAEATGKREEDLDEATVKKGNRAHVVIESYQK